jgi:hypothetical protein
MHLFSIFLTCFAVFKNYTIFHYRRGRISLGM